MIQTKNGKDLPRVKKKIYIHTRTTLSFLTMFLTCEQIFIERDFWCICYNAKKIKVENIQKDA